MDEIKMIFNKNPSATYTLWKAYKSRKSVYSPRLEYPVIHALRSGFVVNTDHMKAFYEICDIRQFDFLHILYPFSLVYPYIMRVLCSKEVPVSIFKVLNTRNSITMNRCISPDERLNIDCHNSEPRLVSKGLEIDIKSVISSGGENVWENITTYFYHGKFSSADVSYNAPKLDPIDNAPIIKKWYFPAENRFRFARISGDTNGIHYGSFYARMMGFKRDFAQPIRVVAKCVSYLPQIRTGIQSWLEEITSNCFPSLNVAEPTGPMRLDFYLKGPVYYESTLTLKNIQIKNGNRFNLYCSGNDKPVICGILQKI